jgi:ABC-type iron transport system FetAB ATPase subunit
MLSVERLQRLSFGPFTLRVADGECVAIAGPSGSGKSVFLRMIADLDPHVGTAQLDDVSREQVAAPRWRRLVTYVAAESGWWEDMVAVHFGVAAEPARALLSAVNLPTEALDWPVARLSSGERQRLALVRALVQEPRALLLDEPTAALDPDATRAVEALLHRVLERGASIVLVSHDPRQADRLATRQFRMEAGQLKARAP